MIRSMTGFGKAAGDFAGQTVTVELSSVNHRYLDSVVRLPSTWAALEPIVKETLRHYLSRGKVNVTVSRKRAAASSVAVKYDAEIARQYIEASRELADLLGATEKLSLNVLAQLEGVFYQEEAGEEIEAARSSLVSVLVEAAGGLDVMRTQEGAALADDLRHRVGLITEALANVEARLPLLNELYEARLRARIEELKTDISLSEERIAIEVAMLADKGDVTEEVVRLKTHLDHMLELLDSEEPVGRRLDFLSQEVQREINTLGVKTRDGDVAKEVLHMKAELERIREQVQNIE